MNATKKTVGLAGMTAGRPSKKTVMSLEDIEPTERINIEVSASQKRKFKIHSAKTGLSYSQLVRQFIDGLPE